ncbi:MAG: MarR family transcriptional regulator [Actinomycetia bacterium]|nr:MarR family transcriptional regulator [Actinomycetes bacterium]MCP4227399.1 MarR family transcriptional regulator [Actinomycetes bacterium]
MTTVSSVDTDVRRRVGRAWRQIRRGASAIRVKDLFYGTGDDTLDLALADALAVVCQQGSLRMGELAEALQITPASTTRAVSCLADKGYVERVKAADDHRSILVSPTEAGQARFEVFNAKIQGGLEEILEEFTPEEQVQLAEYLERYVQSVDRFVAHHAPNHQ